MNNQKLGMKGLMAAIAVSGLLAGCSSFGPLAPPYQGVGAIPKNQMTPVANKKIKYALPRGWSVVPVDRVNPGIIIAAFKKNGTSVNGKILCNNPLLSRQKTGDVMRDGVMASSGTAKSIWGPYALGNSFSDPVVQEYQGSMTTGGREMSMGYWIGYNVNSLSCQYGLLVIGTKADTSGLQRDIISIMGSLQ